jgi:hypothetical protein
MELLVLGLVATIGFASYALWARTQAGDEGPAAERTLLTLQVGDVVQHLGTDYVVEGVLSFAGEDGGPQPRLYRMVDGARERYLYVTGGDGVDPLLLDETALAAGASPADALEHAQQHFRVREVAQATALRHGTVGPRRLGGRVTLRSYSAGAAARLVLLEWADHLDAFAGERVAHHLLDVLPGK